MSSVDQRIVQMKFDSSDFERRIKNTIDSLTSLSKGLKLEGASKGLDNISEAGKRFSLKNIESSVDHIASKFNAMSVIGVAALANIVNKAVNAGLQMVKSLTISPVQSGLKEYETTLNSIQTIMANTAKDGTSLKDVNKALNELNVYSDQTIYNFAEMARNIGTFTAAGVKLDTSVAAIKGIANLAAISGSSADQASTAMYQLSQALATGTVKLMDWNSIVNAGMGGAVFQDALKETARAHGVAVDAIIKKEGSFRDSLQTGWLSSAILTETLSKFTGDLTASQLKTMGYTDAQIVGILKMGKTAKEAATKVKTFSQLIDTLQEAVGSGWATTWQMIFGDFEEARTMWTNVNNVLGGFISASADARNKVLGDWKALGGRTAMITAISNVFKALIAAVKPIKDAFRSIFPATTGKDLYKLTIIFLKFTEHLKIGVETADKIKRTFAGFFAIFGIGWEIIKQVAKTLAGLFSTAGEGSGSFLDITASIGDFLVKLHEAIKTGEGLSKIFGIIGKVLAVPIHLLSLFAELVVNAFSGLSNIDTGGLDNVKERLAPLQKLGQLIEVIWSNLGEVLSDVWSKFEPLTENIGEAFTSMMDAISGSMNATNYTSFLATLNTGLLAGFVLIIRKFLKNGMKGLTGGLVDSINGTFGALTDTMKSMQTQIKANTLLRIAAAIALLTISVVALSLIDADKLSKALTAMAVMFAQLMASMAVFSKIAGTAGFIKMPLLAASLILLAIAVDLLSIAVTRLAKLNWNELAKGLTGVTVLIGALILATKGIAGNVGGMIRTSAGLILLAIAINILVKAVTDLSGLSWGEMIQGLIGVGALLAGLVLFTKFASADKGGISSGAGILLLAVGIKILASALKDIAEMSWGELAKGLVGMAVGLTLMAAALILIPPSSVLSAAAVLIVAASLGMMAKALGQMGGMSWGEIAKGLVTLAGALVLISAALILIPPSSLLSAAAVFIVAASLGMLADALGQMGGMSWGEIAKGLVTLAGALAIIAVGLVLMSGSLSGAAALLIVAASLKILAPILEMFSKMSWSEIAHGLIMLTGVFAVFGIAGALLTPVIPTLLGLGVAITLLGIGMLAAGAGLLLFSLGLTALSISGAAGAAAIVGIVNSLLGLIPNLMIQIGLGIIAFAKVIANSGPSIELAMTVVLNSLMNAINVMAPKIVTSLLKLIVLLLNALAVAVPKMVTAGLKMLTGILNGIANNIDKVVKTATDVIVAFLNALGRNQQRVTDAGVKLIISFINGVADAIRNNSAAMGEAGANLGSAIVEGMIRGLGAGLAKLVSKAKNIAKSALNAAKGALGIDSPSKAFYQIGMYSNVGLANGLDAYSSIVDKSAENVGKNAVKALSNSISGISDAINGDIDFTPVISPILDLSNVKRGADELGLLLSAKPISVDTAYSKAAEASVGYQDNIDAVNLQQDVIPDSKSFEFNQYNTSPKALSYAEIYRQTKNQLSVAKGALAV